MLHVGDRVSYIGNSIQYKGLTGTIRKVGYTFVSVDWDGTWDSQKTYRAEDVLKITDSTNNSNIEALW